MTCRNRISSEAISQSIRGPRNRIREISRLRIAVRTMNRKRAVSKLGKVVITVQRVIKAMKICHCNQHIKLSYLIMKAPSIHLKEMELLEPMQLILIKAWSETIMKIESLLSSIFCVLQTVLLPSLGLVVHSSESTTVMVVQPVPTSSVTICTNS